MSREIDVKALVSHLVRGDGADKCRICLGDTSEGQVYLGDTVMMDGERPVTLAELLEVITGVEVSEAVDLPRSLCSVCSGAAIDAANFSILCRKADSKWNMTVNLLESFPEDPPESCKSLYGFLGDSQMTITTDMGVSKSPTHQGPRYRVERFSPSPPKDVLKMSKQMKGRRNYKLLLCKCPMCDKEFKFAEHLAKHLKESSDNNRACHVCAKVMLRNDLIKHLKEVHKIQPFDCQKCPALFSSKLEIQKHMFADHSKGPYKCGDCGRRFQSQKAYYPHQTIHMLHTCPSCNKVFRNRTCYFYHVRTCCKLDKNRKDAHRTKTKVSIPVENKLIKKNVQVGLRGSALNECICDYCNKKFAGKKFVAAHIQIVHMQLTHRPCPYCGKFLAAARMSGHLKSHVTASLFKCEHCNLALKTKLGYIQHLRLHTGERPYKCKHCGESFSASSRRSEHIRKAHDSDKLVKHACKLCPAQFDQPFKLRKHMTAVHSADAEKGVTFECPECHEKFSSCRGLIHHSRKHQKGIIRKPRKKIMPIQVLDNDGQVPPTHNNEC